LTSDIDKQLKDLEKEFNLEEIELKKEQKFEDDKDKVKKEKVKEHKKRKWGKFFSTKTPRGEPDRDIDETIATQIVSAPFDFWSMTRHELWKLTPDEEKKLGHSFTMAIGPYIPYVMKKFFPVLAFSVTFMQIVESKRRQEARLILERKLDEFSPGMRKKLEKRLGRNKNP